MTTEYLLKNNPPLTLDDNVIRMDTRLKKLAVILVLVMLQFSCILVNMKTGYSEDVNIEVDIFTQKKPYSGRGSGMPSDAFGPGEVVFLYVLATDGGDPLQDLLVAFRVQRPDGDSFTLTQKTNESGISTINFTIPQAINNETEIFGEWSVLANVLIGDIIFQDATTFNVNWIVKLISVMTLNENLTSQASFGIGGEVGLRIALRNIAMCMKSTVLAIVIKDELDVPVKNLEIYDFEVPPNKKFIHLYCKLQIPEDTHMGKATVFISALNCPSNQSGIPYCPATSTFFNVVPYDPLTISFHDVSVIDVIPSAKSVEPGEAFNISVLARNEGTEVESFNTSAYYDNTFVGSMEVIDLPPYSKAHLDFILNTSSINTGNYTISASILPLPEEADLTDNIFVDGIIEIEPEMPSITHDLAIQDINISKTSVYIGESTQINVTVVNEGTEPETFNVDVSYDSSLIATQQVVSLESNTKTKLAFTWNTSQVQEGFYQITAYANPVPGEMDILDNHFVDGIVQVKTKSPAPPSMIHDVAVLTLVPSSRIVYTGEMLDINITVRNEGNFIESFNLIIYYNSSVAGTISVDSLTPNSTKATILHWDTEAVTEGNYTLSALAEPVEDEEDIKDNSVKDGVVEVRAAPTRWFIPYWFWWLLPLLLILILILLAIWLYRRRRRKKSKETFSSGWIALHYCHDLQSKSLKI